MTNRAREFRQHVEDTLIEEGVARPYVFSMARNSHQQVLFSVNGIDVKYQFPYSPSDHRAMLNSRTSLRRAIRAAKGNIIPGAPSDGSVLDARRVLPGQPNLLGAGRAGVSKLAPSVRPRWKTGSCQT